MIGFTSTDVGYCRHLFGWRTLSPAVSLMGECDEKRRFGRTRPA